MDHTDQIEQSQQTQQPSEFDQLTRVALAREAAWKRSDAALYAFVWGAVAWHLSANAFPPLDAWQQAVMTALAAVRTAGPHLLVAVPVQSVDGQQGYMRAEDVLDQVRLTEWAATIARDHVWKE